MAIEERARELLNGWKGNAYSFGAGTLEQVGPATATLGERALVFANSGTWLGPSVSRVLGSLRKAGVDIVGERAWPASRPNAPREDVYRLEAAILRFDPDCIVVVGGGSAIDAVKAAAVLAALGDVEDDVEGFFGVGQVSDLLKKTGRAIKPIVAVQTAAGSAAHLTKYSNVTDPSVGQKKLIVDDAIIPPCAIFDYALTCSAPAELTVDGALDSVAHSLEVFYGIPAEKEELVQEIALLTVELVLQSAPAAMREPAAIAPREALGLAADLGGYAIMVGGTNGGHLTSFSLVDATSHGRACGIMNPYYTVFFAPAIEGRVRAVGELYARAGYMDADLTALDGRELGEAVARGMIAFAKAIGMPTTLAELPGFTDAHIDRALQAAKNPQLEMKLKTMPVPLDAGLVDEYMGPILQAAKTGDFSLIRCM
ncbi:MAG: iron-containing alcohol dehydrogenase [Lentisphaerae bacterium]|jgi:alcohol dehydrogenase|nr:iron-containing alcohol dehydrogenase [Lentisphaerota bacterium]MBT4818226.1 iron-containing alcohol dehydrogenase [Lentisphaerota bacterium]MBT5613009.1 iron-containing alcohol dehydrogenase [Lentisphaerota bacterium]MBT7056745.1 iron-containing alcohol dehydrogenase [Lentisphaerota bacterium]MBT7843737.1 iron-containing alcohol dehydrogenase [Lentisphaerota bacterium]